MGKIRRTGPKAGVFPGSRVPPAFLAARTTDINNFHRVSNLLVKCIQQVYVFSPTRLAWHRLLLTASYSSRASFNIYYRRTVGPTLRY